MELQEIKHRFDIVGDDSRLNDALDTAVQVARTDLSVLVTGESGVGKEVIPQIIHQYSARKHNTYIAINCGSIPEGTVDSELFGHEKGAFTGAVETKKGYFEVADGGTIFLDEVAELPVSTQVRLLRVLQSGEFFKVGSAKVQKTNVRVVAATNVNLEQAIKDGKFREDLYYRISTVPIHVPPLRERKEDINLLFRKFASDFAENYRMPAIRLNHDAQVLLCEYPWPGNIRQLMSIAQRISALEQVREISAAVLRKYLPVQNFSNENLPALASKEEDMLSNGKILLHMIMSLKKEMAALKEKVDSMSSSSMDNQALEPSRFNDFEMVDDIMGDPLENNSESAPSYYSVNNEPEQLSYAQDDSQSPLTKDIEEEEKLFSIKEKYDEMIRECLVKHNGNRKKAAVELGISERTLYRKIDQMGLEGKKKRRK